MTEKKNYGRALFITALILLLSITLLLGINTNWGKIKIDRIDIPVENGYLCSGILYLPEGASAETPLPAALVMHGGNDNAQTFNGYSIELARRGFVVVNLDENGIQYSDYDPDFDNYFLAEEVAAWMKGLAFIDENRIVATGHSMGGLYSPYACTNVGLAGAIPINSNRQNLRQEELIGNYAFVFGKGDQLNRYDKGDNTVFFNMAFGMDEMPEAGKVYGSIETNDYRVFVWEDDAITTHTAGTYNKSVVQNVVHYAQLFTGHDSGIPDDRQVYQVTYWVSLVGMFALAAFAVCLWLVLSQLPAFASLSRPLGKYMGYTGKKWFGSAALTMIPQIPLLYGAYYLVAKKLKVNGFIPVACFNKWMPYLVAMGIWDIATFFLLFYRKKKKEGITDYDLGFTWGGDKKETLRNIFKCFELSLVVTAVVLGILDLMDRELCVGFKFFFAGIRPASIDRIKMSGGYILLAVIIYLGAQFGSNIVRRLPSTDHPGRDMVRDIAVNSIVAGGCLSLFFIAQMICQSNGIFVPFFDDPAVYQFYGFMVLIWLTQGINTALYRKTGSIWPAMTLLPLLFGILLNANYPLSFTF